MSPPRLLLIVGRPKADVHYPSCLSAFGRFVMLSFADRNNCGQRRDGLADAVAIMERVAPGTGLCRATELHACVNFFFAHAEMRRHCAKVVILMLLWYRRQLWEVCAASMYSALNHDGVVTTKKIDNKK